ncbi:hypothetical protein [Dyadobacter sp. CY356]|uniref:hypothetical protein n=1 Tax=Dyadobacter sp. CY356 TaxID=2906442 RepID=UPI001F37BEA1|nr:hypothetical protein [Dyadobacter sp. CY356]MCF0054204.1 hypothetical protein [Dyadobacter sp. CY356]
MKNPDFIWSENSLVARLYIQYSVLEMPLSFEPFLYQTKDYLNVTSSYEKFSFYLFRSDEIAARACIHFTKDCHDLISPARAPFGGVQCDQNCNAGEIKFLLHCVENWFSKQSNPAVKLKGAPSCYYANGTYDLLSSAYEMSGYKVIGKCINCHIPISPSPFSMNITAAERRRLAKCKESGFCTEIYDKPDIDIVYDFIKESRNAKGYLLSITKEQLDILIYKFPQQYKLFVVTDQSKIIALAITVRVCQDVLYNFLPADLYTYKCFSPTVYLTEAIYNYCQEEEIAVLDMGLSLDHHGNQKPGLLKFKKNLGGEESVKITYQKVL